jgi:predicted RNA-binding Zn-ribbon protein involved in translation (DUF1610 family)
MRCKTCDYPLWNLKARQCPECGTPFRPSDFEFAPGAVRFLCPHCGTAYEGTSEHGRLEPVEFACAGCGQNVHMDQMCVTPAEGVSQTAPAVMPWLERRNRGVVPAFFHTVGLAMTRPGRLMRGVPVSAGTGESLIFAMLVMVFVLLVGFVLPLLVMGGFMPLGAFGYSGLIYAAYFVVPGVAMMVSVLLIWPMIAHLVLRWTGGCRHSIDRTYQAFGYGAGANLVSAVPCIGPYFGWLWWMVSSILMLREGQRVSGGRATLAVMALPLLVSLVFAVFLIVVTHGISGSMGGMTSGPPGGWGGPAQQTLMFAQQNQQAGAMSRSSAPAHCIEYLLGNSQYASQMSVGMLGAGSPFCQAGTKTTPADIPVADITLKDFLAATPSGQLKAASKLLDQQPANLVADRFGDFIFTFHGARSTVGDSSLWVVVMLPDPDVNGTPQPGDPIFLGMGDGSVTQTTYAQLPALLQQQNQYRGTLALPSLPDLITITHNNPATSAAPSSPSTAPAQK